MKTGEYYQQGDVLMKRVDGVKGKKVKHLVLAKGESTGHAHTVIEGDAVLYEHEGTLFLHVESESAVIGHEEHGAVTIEKGDYEIRIVREFDHFAEEARNVQD